MENTNKLTTSITEKFFALRFPEKDIEFEKKCGYFGEWEQRFAKGEPLGYADKESKEVIMTILPLLD